MAFHLWTEQAAQGKNIPTLRQGEAGATTEAPALHRDGICGRGGCAGGSLLPR